MKTSLVSFTVNDDPHNDLHISLLFIIYLHLFFLVKAAVLEFPDVTGVEGESASLRCRAIGDPAPQMTIRKTGEADPYELGSSVSLNS